MRKLLTVKDLSELFSKHENTIYRWIVVDHLFPNAFRVKDGWYVPHSDVAKLIKSGRLNGTDVTANPTQKPPGGGFVKGWRG